MTTYNLKSYKYCSGCFQVQLERQNSVFWDRLHNNYINKQNDTKYKHSFI
jgi:hypothetical protein